MTFELDHLFVVSSLGAPEAERLAALGLVEGSRNIHCGQGTANRRFFFRNAMLELLWVHDEDEARSPEIAPTGLFERFHYRRTGASPFGICLRATQRASFPSPFETWSYRPPYLPMGLEIPIVRARSIAEPMVFILPFGRRPEEYSQEGREPMDHASGFQEIRAVRITLVGEAEISPALRTLEQLGIVTWARGHEPLMELSFDEATKGEAVDLRADLPLVLRW